MAEVRTPKCGNYQCNNRIPLERWVWGSVSALTCSSHCASVCIDYSRTTTKRHYRDRCSRPGCTNMVKKNGLKYCSPSCGQKAKAKPDSQILEKVRMRPGDRWEKVAPQMFEKPERKDAVRDQQIQEIILEETVGRSWP